LSPGSQFQIAYVTFGTARATALAVVSAASLTCVTPAGAAGAATVYVTSPAGTVTFPWTYTGTPPVTGAILLETGDALLTEAGDRLLLES
jgi:hypothetical protein